MSIRGLYFKTKIILFFFGEMKSISDMLLARKKLKIFRAEL